MACSTALTLGFFDGVHRGHQVLLARTVEAARRLHVEPVAVTFDLPRREVIGHRGRQQTIDTIDERIARLKAGGMAWVEVIRFTPSFAQQSGERFVQATLVEQLGARQVVVGHDFRFGQGRSCGVDDLRAYCAGRGVEVDIVEPQTINGERVSSRAVREALTDGDLARAELFLGRRYELSGPVVEGRRLGRQLGFPTANVEVDPRKLLPALGVYAALVSGEGVEAPAVLNLGFRPTVSGSGRLSVEAHLLDWSGDLYGQVLRVEFVARLRAEQRFDGVDALRKAIAADCDQARAILGLA